MFPVFYAVSWFYSLACLVLFVFNETCLLFNELKLNKFCSVRVSSSLENLKPQNSDWDTFFFYTHRAFLLYANLLLNYWLKIFNCLSQPIINGGQNSCLSHPFICNVSSYTFIFSIWSIFVFFFSWTVCHLLMLGSNIHNSYYIIWLIVTIILQLLLLMFYRKRKLRLRDVNYVAQKALL